MELDDIRSTLTEEEQDTALELGIIQLCRLKLEELEREVINEQGKQSQTKANL